MAKDKAQIINDIELLEDCDYELHRAANDPGRGLKELDRLYDEAIARGILDPEEGVDEAIEKLKVKLYERD